MPQDNSLQFNIHHYLGVLQKRKYLSLAVALAVLSVFTWGSLFWPKSYEASSTVFIQKSAVMDPLIQGVGVSGSMEDRLRTLRDSILSRNIIERVVKKLDLDVSTKSPAKYENLIENIRDNITITTKSPKGKEAADLFTISFIGSNPRKVRDIVNALVNEYIGENLGFRRSDAYGAFEFIQAQLLEYKAKLDESDKSIREFREKNPQLVPQSETTLLGRMENFQSAKIEADIKLKELLRRREGLKKQLSGEKELTVTFVSKDGSPQSRLSYLNNQLVLLMSKFTEKHPEVIKVKSEIEELKKQIAQSKNSQGDGAGSEMSSLNPIYQQIREDMTKTDAEIESLRARSSELYRQQQSTQGMLGRMPKEQEEWSKLQRDRNVYQKIYDDLLQKLENARVSKDLEGTDKSEAFRIVDPAILPLLPVKPNRVKMIGLGIFLGIASGIGAAFGLESLNKSFKDDDSIEEILKLPVLASVKCIDVAASAAETMAARQFDKKVFTATGVYLLLVIMLLVNEALRRYMGISIVNF